MTYRLADLGLAFLFPLSYVDILYKTIDSLFPLGNAPAALPPQKAWVGAVNYGGLALRVRPSAPNSREGAHMAETSLHQRRDSLLAPCAVLAWFPGGRGWLPAT